MAASPVRVLALNPSLDRLVETDSVRAGVIHRVRLLSSVPGGKALNVARTLRTLHAPVRLLGLFGHGLGELLCRQLRADGIEVDAVLGPHACRISMSVWGEEDPRLTEFYEAGENVADEVVAELREAFTASLVEASWCVISGSAPPGLESPDFVAMACRAGASTAIDLAGPDLSGALEHGPALVKINQAEAGELLGRELRTMDDAAGACVDIRSRAGDDTAVVVTLGTQGAAGADSAGDCWEVDVPSHGRFPVGSGDAFLGGMVAALAEGRGFPDALVHGAAVGMANAENPGPAIFDGARALAHVDEIELLRL